MSDLPDPWATWATRAGVRPSMTGIGESAGVPASTVSRLIRGRTTSATVKAVAGALRVSTREVLAAVTGESLGPWEPPLSAHLLDAQEREALALLIQRITADRGGISDGSAPEAEKTPNEGVTSAAPDMLDVRDEAIRIAIQENSALAARHGHEAGKMNPAGEAQKLAGEDDQDDGGEDPA